MDWLYWLVVVSFWSLVIFVIYIPLPGDIADRKKLVVLEFFLRLGNEYLADFVELVAGAAVRNKFLRMLMAIAYYIPRKNPEDISVKWDNFAGVPVRVYQPKERKSNAGVMFIHGGGWSTMRAEYYDDILFVMARRLGCCMFSIDYRLAPEHPYPAPVDDCENATRTLFLTKYKEYDIDRDHVAIIGDSAGGNLSAVVAQRLQRQNFEHKLKCQVLIYPVIHMFGFRSPSYTAYYAHYNGSALLNPQSMARWSLFYLGLSGNRGQVHTLMNNHHINQKLLMHPTFSKHIPEYHLNLDDAVHEKRADDQLASIFYEKATNPDICPILAESLKGLPPAMVMTAGYDILRDEGILYAKRLQAEGVPTEWKHYDACYHGIFNMPYSPLKNQMMKDIVAYLSVNL